MSGVAFSTPAEKYRLSSAPVAAAVDSGMSGVAGAAEGDDVGPWHPSSPLLAFAVLAGLTFGLMAVSASVRVGKTTAGVNVGST